MTTDEKTKRPGAATTAKQSNASAAARAASSKPSAPAPKSQQSAVPRATTSAQGAAPRPASVVTEGMTPGKKLTYEERMRRLAPIVRVRRKVDSTIKRFANLADEVRRWKNAPDLREAASKVETALAGLLAEATTTADTFQPERERKASANQLKPGTKVSLRDKFVARYERRPRACGAREPRGRFDRARSRLREDRDRRAHRAAARPLVEGHRCGADVGRRDPALRGRPQT